MKSKCLVCTSKEAIYKCPKCYLPFCSVTCGRNHKKVPCQRKQQSQNQPHVKHQASKSAHQEKDDELLLDEYAISSQRLSALDNHEEVQRKIRDERLMTILERIDKASNRANALEKEMRNPEFLEFCDDVLEALQMKEPERRR